MFYLGANFLCFSKDKLSEEDKRNLVNQSDFEILMSIMNSKGKEYKASILSVEMVLSLLFPDYELVKMPNIILLNKVFQDGSKEQCIINNDNFNQFKEIIQAMFCLDLSTSGGYNPANKLAEQIAKKLEQRHKKLSQKDGNEKKEISILYRYVSILTLGNHHTIPQLMEYTVYQLFNEFQRFEKKYSYDSWFSAKLAGAEGLEDVQHWLSDQDQITERLPQSNRIEF